MNITACISRIAIAAVSAMTLLLSLTSCNGAIYDEEGDCEVIYRLRFRYDMNMKFADAFSHEVKSVHLYAFDSEDKLVWQTVESGERLAQEGYNIVLPLNPGDYRLMAWCGLDNGESFTVPEIGIGDTRDPLHCRLNRTTHPEDGAISTEDLHPLFHGTLDVNLPENLDGGEYVYTMPLTKDTNVFRIVLQHLSGRISMPMISPSRSRTTTAGCTTTTPCATMKTSHITHGASIPVRQVLIPKTLKQIPAPSPM